MSNTSNQRCCTVVTMGLSCLVFEIKPWDKQLTDGWTSANNVIYLALMWASKILVTKTTLLYTENQLQ